MVLLAVNFENLHQILQSLYVDMMPLCSQMTGVAKGLAGLGALFYVAYRVWQSLARAEPIDVFPQGTRRRGQTIAETPLKPGAAMISLKAGVPIIPVRIKMKGDRYRPFRKNELIIGRPITVEELAYDPEASGEYARVTEIIRNRIAELE